MHVEAEQDMRCALPVCAAMVLLHPVWLCSITDHTVNVCRLLCLIACRLTLIVPTHLEASGPPLPVSCVSALHPMSLSSLAPSRALKLTPYAHVPTAWQHMAGRTHLRRTSCGNCVLTPGARANSAVRLVAWLLQVSISE